MPQGAAARGLRWLVPLVALIHLAGWVLLASYSALNLRPDLPAAGIGGEGRLFALASLLATAVPTAATWLYMRPIRQWSARSSAGWQEPIPSPLAQRCANLPMVAAAQALVCWMLLVFPALLRGWVPEGAVSRSPQFMTRTNCTMATL